MASFLTMLSFDLFRQLRNILLVFQQFNYDVIVLLTIKLNLFTTSLFFFLLPSQANSYNSCQWTIIATINFHTYIPVGIQTFKNAEGTFPKWDSHLLHLTVHF